MIRHMDQMFYAYIMSLEVALFMKYKVQLFEIENRLTLLDLQSFVNSLQMKTQEIEDNTSKDNINKCLIYIRDTLNYMTLGDQSMR